jgi:hypothetical protein
VFVVRSVMRINWHRNLIYNGIYRKHQALPCRMDQGTFLPKVKLKEFRIVVLMKFMHSPQLKSRVRTLSAVVAASVALPALAYADRDNDRVNHGRGDNHEHQGKGDNNERHGNPRISAVPEANAGWVLVPFFGAVLLFSARHLFRGKVTE